MSLVVKGLITLSKLILVGEFLQQESIPLATFDVGATMAWEASWKSTKKLGIAQPPLQIQASSGALPDIRGGFKHVPRVRL